MLVGELFISWLMLYTSQAPHGQTASRGRRVDSAACVSGCLCGDCRSMGY